MLAAAYLLPIALKRLDGVLPKKQIIADREWLDCLDHLWPWVEHLLESLKHKSLDARIGLLEFTEQVGFVLDEKVIGKG